MALGQLQNDVVSDKSSLTQRLAKALPKDARFTINHVSSPPTKCAAIFAAPPGQKPQITYCESHFLTVSITPPQGPGKDQLLVFAIEVLIYTTADLTTLFVSKADSTGYLHLLNLPRASISPLKSVASIFLRYLADTRQRPGVKLVISLFARAQDQYLFPGSIENKGKHVLDDKGLVKWWAQVLDPVLRSQPTQDTESAITAQGYLIVPGFDKNETLPFFPSTVRSDPPNHKRWSNFHPLRELSPHPTAPPRCLIPHFPDDPKSRFLDELDEEIYGSNGPQPNESPMKRASLGYWKSVKTLEQFWEMMAFRQECSSGRLVGFLWVVFTPPDDGPELDLEGFTDSQASYVSSASATLSDIGVSLPTPSESQNQSRTGPSRKRSHHAEMPLSPGASSPIPESPIEGSVPQVLTSRLQKLRTGRKRLRGPIISRQPRIKVARAASLESEVPAESKYFLWPRAGRGQVVLEEHDYKRVFEVLLRLDFANEDVACSSTRKWLDEVALVAGTKKDWGDVVVGTKLVEHTSSAQIGNTNVLDMGLVRKKKKSEIAPAQAREGPDKSSGVLDSDLVETKLKVVEKPQLGRQTASSGVNVLGNGFIRKKPKA